MRKGELALGSGCVMPVWNLPLNVVGRCGFSCMLWMFERVPCNLP